MKNPTGKNFELSCDFYIALGFTLNFEEESIAELKLGGSRFYLQRYYQKKWCENMMIHITVDDAEAWHRYVSKVIRQGSFGPARVTPPKLEDYGALVTYVWDPSGILIHFAEPRDK